MVSQHFDRPVMIDIAKDGTVTCRGRHKVPFAGSVPIFSVNTPEEARSLFVYLCTEQQAAAGDRWFIFDGFSGDVIELPEVTRQFITAYERLFSEAARAA